MGTWGGRTHLLGSTHNRQRARERGSSLHIRRCKGGQEGRKLLARCLVRQGVDVATDVPGVGVVDGGKRLPGGLLWGAAGPVHKDTGWCWTELEDGDGDAASVRKTLGGGEAHSGLRAVVEEGVRSRGLGTGPDAGALSERLR